MQITGGAAPAQYSFGNTGRNVLFGPGTNNLDFDLHRDFPIPWESEYAWSFVQKLSTSLITLSSVTLEARSARRPQG